MNLPFAIDIDAGAQAEAVADGGGWPVRLRSVGDVVARLGRAVCCADVGGDEAEQEGEKKEGVRHWGEWGCGVCGAVFLDFRWCLNGNQLRLPFLILPDTIAKT